MAEQDRGTDDGPNLELPSFRIGRRKKGRDRGGQESPSAEQPPAQQEPSSPEQTRAGHTPSPDASGSGPEGTGTDEPDVPGPTTEQPAATTADQNGAGQTGTGQRAHEGPPAEQPAPDETAGAPRTSRTWLRRPRKKVRSRSAATAETGGGTATRVADAPATTSDTTLGDGGAGAEGSDGPVEREEGAIEHQPLFTLPPVRGWIAAVITGLVVGATLVLLTYASLRLCEIVRGTSSCGGPGLLLMAGVLIALVFLGRALLSAWDVPDPLSTSLLAVGLLAVIVLLILVDVVFSPTMAIVIPLVAMATFALSHWVTTSVVEPAEN